MYIFLLPYIYIYISKNLIIISNNILIPTHKSSDYKLSAVKYYLSHSKNQVQTCKIFGCSERSLMRWVKKYKSTNNITRKKRDYTSYKISNSHISFIKQQLKQNKTITM
jgi:transposase-like protein